jgi:hypothetical protein
MARSFSRTEAFSFYGVQLINANWSWSGVSADGLTVAISIWFDELDRRGGAGALAYERVDMSDWADGPGKRYLFEHLRWAFDHCNGTVRIVVSVRDLNDRARTIDCYPQPNLIMRITHLDTEAGAFRLEQVVPDVQAA